MSGFPRWIRPAPGFVVRLKSLPSVPRPLPGGTPSPVPTPTKAASVAAVGGGTLRALATEAVRGKGLPFDAALPSRS